jgi:hypothetical protein
MNTTPLPAVTARLDGDDCVIVYPDDEKRFPASEFDHWQDYHERMEDKHMLSPSTSAAQALRVLARVNPHLKHVKQDTGPDCPRV